MLDVLLINIDSTMLNNSIDVKKETPPLGLMYLAASLEKYDYSVNIYDIRLSQKFLGKIIKKVKKLKPQIIGISIYTNGYIYTKHVINILKMIFKEDIKIVVGGPHVTTYPQIVQDNPNIDFAVIGEGENTIVELANHLIRKKGNLKKICGITYLDNGKQIFTEKRTMEMSLEKFDYPARHLVDLSMYEWPGGIISSRGCPGRCIFCAAPYLSMGKYRRRNVKNIVSEVAYIVEKYNIRYINFLDDTFTASKNQTNWKKAREFKKELATTIEIR